MGDETCPLCDGTEIYEGQVTHRPTCARITEPAVIVADLANLTPRTTDVEGLTVCRFCAVAETTKRRLSAPNSHEFACLWRRARALFPDGAVPNG